VDSRAFLKMKYVLLAIIHVILVPVNMMMNVLHVEPIESKLGLLKMAIGEIMMENIITMIF
jgi:hypothetical protein